MSVYILVLCMLYIDPTKGTKNSVCPEFKKLYPRDCRLFYKCVPLLDSAQAYVWVPTRCTAGMVFHPALKTCVLREMMSDCKENEVKRNVMLNAMDPDGVPLSVVNTPSVDLIGNQMHRLKDLINSLKASSTQVNPVVYIDSVQKLPHRDYVTEDPKKTSEVNFVPTQLSKITSQLVMQTHNLQQYANLNSLTHNDDAFARIKQNLGENSDVVNSLFEKYLSNNTFLSGGEFVKNTSFPAIETAKNPEQASKISTVIGLTDKNSFTVHNYRTSLIPHLKSSQSKACLEGERLPHLSDCTRYYICGSNNTVIHMFTCPPNTGFNAEKTSCDVDEYKRCKQKKHDYKRYRTDNVTCTSHSRFPVPKLTTQYIICIFEDKFGWKPYRLNCPISMEFCIRKQICLPKQNCT